ncbi:MAG: winged helix-turn-helix transcriptional regulator [Rhodospirillaceae bacterium]|nr:winged helix-turn-helix transcriptional regulator [Rhodospirillaceae bacterium]
MPDTAVPSGSGLSFCTASRVRKAARLVSQIFDRHLERYDLTITQFGLLAYINTFDGIGIGDLAGKLVMDPTTVTRNLRPLQRRGLVALAADPNDRRARRLHLTADGRAALKDAKPGWSKAQREVEAALGDADTAALHATLDRALAKLSA